ncbi:hypothetical protein V9T40_002186 [Parthenolecanium corni]|uniref:Lipase domain-containing protein n=1 Tax=Parthenolecanium corni TaxID=536013 RepID=A0AAN9TKA8_9HEMI
MMDNDVWDPEEHANDLNNSKSVATVEEDEIIFKYYNKDYHSGDRIFTQNISESTLKGWRRNTALKVITHGWLSSDESGAVEGIKEAYLQKQDVNIITVDWSESASWKVYPLPAYMTQQVGAIIARLIDHLVNNSYVSLEDVHIIGHSLGSHVAGASGAAVATGRVARITGLDPAGPGFEVVHHLHHNSLDTTDALFVDIIHTAGGAAGYYSTLGHVDFYPNGGTPMQPGCLEDSNSVSGLSQSYSCSHGRSYEFYKDSILHPHTFKAWQCENWQAFENKSCENNQVIYMGDETPSR